MIYYVKGPFRLNGRLQVVIPAKHRRNIMFKFDFDMDEIDEGVQSVFSAQDVQTSHEDASNRAHEESEEEVSLEISLDDLVCRHSHFE